MPVGTAGPLSRSQTRLVTLILVPATLVVLLAFAAARYTGTPLLADWLDNLHWTVAFGTATLLAWLGVRWADSETRDARRWFAIGITISFVAQLTWDFQTAIAFADFPAPSDWLFICFGPCCLAGLWHTIRRQPDRPPTWVLLLDLLTLAAVVSMIVLALFLPRHTGPMDLTLFLQLAYPISMLTSSCLALIMVPTLRLALGLQSGTFVVASMANGAGWLTWLYLAKDDAVVTNTWLYLTFSIVTLAMGAGTLLWRVDRATNADWIRRCNLTSRVLPLWVVAAAIVSALLVWSVSDLNSTAGTALYLNSGLVMLLAAIRQSVLLFERDRLLSIEKRHTELENTFQSLSQVTRNGLALLEPDGRFREMNPGCIALLGYNQEQGQHITIADVNAGPAYNLKGPLGLVDENGNGIIETICRRQDGTLVHVELTSALIPNSGGQLYVILRNITERKQADTQLQSMAQRLAIATRTAGIAIWEHRPADNTLSWDEHMHKLYDTDANASPRKLQDAWSQRVHPDDLGGVRALYRESIAAGHGYHTEYRLVLPNGSLRYIEAWGDVQLDASGKPERFIGVNMDITVRKQAEATRQRLEAQLLHSQKLEAIGTLASGIAHDFNNILGAILGNIELALQDTHADHPASVSMQEIRKAGQRGKDLIRRIVSFGKPNELEFRPTHLAVVIEDSLKLVRAVLPATVEITCQLDSHAPPVLIDSSQIAQVLLNLCTNAYQAMDQQKGRIDITLSIHQFEADAAQIHRDLKSGRYVCLHISDTGSGIDPAIVDRIFEPFFTTKSMTDGSGLGLSVVHNIVRSHHGAIVLDTTPGSGSTFHIYLPAPVSVEATDATAKLKITQSPGKGTGQHLLYVDDEDSLVFLTKRMLERFGYRVTCFTDAKAALQAALAADADFDLIITDHSMPVMSGLDLARELFSKRPDSRIVLVSGYLSPHDVERARAIGIHDVILKPDTVDELAAAVHRLLSK